MEKCGCRMFSPTSDNLARLGELVRSGELVAFPTETVYGLGANALNADACRKIYEYKQRPLTDPLIVHVTSVQAARDLCILNPVEEGVFYHLAEQF